MIECYISYLISNRKIECKILGLLPITYEHLCSLNLQT